MINNKLKYIILALAIIVVVLIVVIVINAGQPQPTTIFHTPWFDIVK